MNRFIVLVGAIVLLCTIAIGGFLFWRGYDADQHMQEARQGIEKRVVELPKLQEFDTVQVKFENFPVDPPKRISGTICYYGRATVMLGTHKSASDALNTYTDALRRAGWVLRDPEYNTSKVLQRGGQEQINVVSREPALALRQYMDGYSDARDRYPTILFVLLDYKTPSDTGC